MYGFRRKYQRNNIKEEAVSHNNNPTRLVELNTTKEQKKSEKIIFRHMPRNLSNINNFENDHNKIDEDNKIKNNYHFKEEATIKNKYNNYKIDKMSLSYKKYHKIIPLKEKNSEEKKHNQNNINIFIYDPKKGTIENEFEEENNRRKNNKLKNEHNIRDTNLEKEKNESNENKNKDNIYKINENEEEKYEIPYIKKYFNRGRGNNINGGDNKPKNKSINKRNKINTNIKRIKNEIDDKGINNIYNNELFDRLKNEFNKIERVNAEKKLKGNMLELVNDVVRSNLDFKENIFFRNLDNTSKKIGNMDKIHKRAISHTYKEIDIDDILK